MVICESYMFELSVHKDIKKTIDKRRTPTSLLGYLLTPIVKKSKISVEQDRVVTILIIIKH